MNDTRASTRQQICLGRRAFLVGLTLATTATFGRPAAAKSSDRPPLRVLFVCEAGTVKSAVAREVFRARAAARGIRVTAFSRGIAPAEHVSPALRQHLIADDIEPTRDGVNMLTQADLKAADVIVVFNRLPENLKARHVLDWSALPSMNDTYPQARAYLDLRIDALLDTIERQKPQ